MGEHKLNGNARMIPSLIDMSVSENAIREGRKQFCHTLSERLLVAMADASTDPQHLIDKAWKLAQMQYDRMILERAAPSTPVTLTERMAADNISAAAQKGFAQ